MSKRKKRCFSSLLPPFLSTLLLPYARTRAPTDRKHCFHSFINLAEGNIYRRIHGCIHSRPRFMRPYPFLHTRPHWNWFRPARPMGCASTATGKINTRPLSFPGFFFLIRARCSGKRTPYICAFYNISWLIGGSIGWCRSVNSNRKENVKILIDKFSTFLKFKSTFIYFFN